MNQYDKLLKRLQLLEDLESIENANRSRCFIGTSSQHIDTSKEHEYMKNLFPKSVMTQSEIMEVVSREKWRNPLFVILEQE